MCKLKNDILLQVSLHHGGVLPTECPREQRASNTVQHPNRGRPADITSCQATKTRSINKTQVLTYGRQWTTLSSLEGWLRCIYMFLINVNTPIMHLLV